MSYEISKAMGGTMETEKDDAVRQTAASQFMESLEGVRLLAAKVSEETSERLASVMLEPTAVGYPVEEQADVPSWPPLFSDMRSKVDDIDASLRRIIAYLRATEL